MIVRAGTSDTPYREVCGVNETSEHFLLHCSLYDNARSDTMDCSKDTGVIAKLKGKTSEGLLLAPTSVIFVNENKNENGEKRENNEFVNEN